MGCRTRGGAGLRAGDDGGVELSGDGFQVGAVPAGGGEQLRAGTAEGTVDQTPA
ncbi:hypothetical protein [Streptacidiphilus jiangxiensis]|uniref:hypothetical protein n=1 Tax=Streptacidiphilus jiangxiensis TaxID=235985 RepID=UPI001376B932|nr:hypothetical protein [Streptacidiphilus jiangxiensis]